MIRTAFIDDDSVFLHAALESIHMQADILCLIAAKDIEHFWSILPTRAQIDVLFLDIDLPGQSGIEALPTLRRRFPQAEIIMLTYIEDSDMLMRAFHNGASGYLNKDFPILQLPEFFSIIKKGGALISPRMSRKLIEYFTPNAGRISNTELSSKESQLLKLFSLGKSYEDTAAAMGISVNGVRYHVKNIYQKLHVNNKIDAITQFNRLHE